MLYFEKFDCYLSINALVTEGIRVKPNRFVPAGAIIDTQEKADALRSVSESEQDFAEEVQYVNNQFPTAYACLFGDTRCSCGLACHSNTIKDILE